jgi:DNA topoisomerase-1
MGKAKAAAVKKEVEKDTKKTPKKEKVKKEEDEEETKRRVKEEGEDSDAGEEEEDEEKDSDQEEDEEYKWWKDPNLVITKKGERQWDTLRHNGPMFPPPYEPHGIPILYKGEVFPLNPEEEEIATYYATMRNATQYYYNPKFRANFLFEWKKVLNKRVDKNGNCLNPIQRLDDLALCNFDRIWDWWVAGREAKKNRTKEEKQAAKKADEALRAPYKYCLWNVRQQELAAYRIEPPGLFRGRGKHPKQGLLKARIQPEDVTINIGEGEPIPPCPAGHHWKEVIHDHNVQWLAMFHDSVGGNVKYMQLAASGARKQINDREKFEKARKLKEHVVSIREAYRKDWVCSDVRKQQLAVCTYFIDKLALRCGGEKGEDEADTVGCTSLRVEHVIPQPINPTHPKHVLHFSFLGKDSVPYENDVEVDPLVYNLIIQFCRGKKPFNKELIFDRVSPSELNDHLKQFMPELTAKVFRTYNASYCLDQYFRDHPMPKGLTEAEKVLYFNDANLAVAVLCNHQRQVSKTHEAGVENIQIKLHQLETLRDRLKKLKDDLEKNPKQRDRLEKAFFEEEDRVQLEWLNKWGTDVERQEYIAVVAKRDKISEEQVQKRFERLQNGDATAVKDEKEDEALAEVVGAKRGRGKQAKVEVEEEAEEEPAPKAKKQRGESPAANGAKGKKAAKPSPKASPSPSRDSGKKSKGPSVSPRAAKASPKRSPSPKTAKKSPPKAAKKGKK